MVPFAKASKGENFKTKFQKFENFQPKGPQEKETQN